MPDAKYCPREPTREMLDAVPLLSKGVIKADDAMRSVVWRAMYDAAQAEPREPTTDYERKCMTPPPDDWPPDRSGSPEEIRAAKERLKRLIREADAAPSPAAEDGLVERLRFVRRNEIAAKYPLFADLTDEAAAHIERQAQEIAELRRNCDSWLDQANRRANGLVKDIARFADERDAALRRAEALHTALRKEVIQHGEFNAYCACCGLEWSKFDPNERHDSGCLASPAIRAQGDDRG